MKYLLLTTLLFASACSEPDSVLECGCLESQRVENLKIHTFINTDIVGAISSFYQSKGHPPLPVTGKFECNFKQTFDEHGTILHLDEETVRNVYSYFNKQLGEPGFKGTKNFLNTYPAEKYGMGIMFAHSKDACHASIIIVEPKAFKKKKANQ